MSKNGRLTEDRITQRASGSLRGSRLEDEAERLFDVYLETFEKAPESDFLLKRYFFTMYFEKKYLQDLMPGHIFRGDE